MKLKHLFIALFGFTIFGANAQESEVQYLSGTDKDNTRKWEFFCSEGRNSGHWTTIEVPGHWDTQGFGGYNYGHDAKPPVRKVFIAMSLPYRQSGKIRRFILCLRAL